MCRIIVIDHDKEIETPNELQEHFGFPGVIEEFYNEIIGDACLCQIDIDKTFNDHGIKYSYDPEMMHYNVLTQ